MSLRLGYLDDPPSQNGRPARILNTRLTFAIRVSPRRRHCARRRIAWSRDGRYLYAAVSDADSDIVMLARLN